MSVRDSGAPPATFDELVDEIAACAELPRAEVRAKLWQEAVGPGNVELAAAHYGVTPHRYDAAMERLYRESDAFIFETLTYAQKPRRRAWNAAVLARIRHHAETLGLPPAALRVLIFGDGCGEDTLFLASHGCRVDYFDVPGSRTSAFATRRFARRGVLDRCVRVLTDLGTQSGVYDVVVSLEVLEHLPKPLEGIRTIAAVLKSGGIALISEAFDCVSPAFPTHLACNVALRDSMHYLCLRHGLVLAWDNPQQPSKPTEFRREEACLGTTLGGLLRSRWTLRGWLFLLLRGRWREAALHSTLPFTNRRER